MKRNVGAIDAIIRTDVAFVLAYLYYTNSMPGLWLTIGLIFAGHLLATAVYGTDPLYRLMNLSTNKGSVRCTGCKKDTCITCKKGVCETCGKNKTCTC